MSSPTANQAEPAELTYHERFCLVVTGDPHREPMVPGYDLEHVMCIRETEKAILVWPVNEWVPKRQITKDSEVRDYGDQGLLCVTEWIAEKKGWL